jgi:hypothetical protein
MFFATAVLSLLAGAALSAPVNSKSAAVAAESWTIPTMSTHYMGTNSGLPGGQWPEGSEFNTTISFTLMAVSSVDETTTTTNCAASWTAGPPEDFPKTWTACSAAGVSFKFDEAAYTGPYKFSLQIQKET